MSTSNVKKEAAIFITENVKIIQCIRKDLFCNIKQCRTSLKKEKFRFFNSKILIIGAEK